MLRRTHFSGILQVEEASGKGEVTGRPEAICRSQVMILVGDSIG